MQRWSERQWQQRHIKTLTLVINERVTSARQSARTEYRFANKTMTIKTAVNFVAAALVNQVNKEALLTNKQIHQ